MLKVDPLMPGAWMVALSNFYSVPKIERCHVYGCYILGPRADADWTLLWTSIFYQQLSGKVNKDFGDLRANLHTTRFD